MNAQEALMLCRLAKSMCPQQAMDEYSPDAWLPLLDDLRFVDCKDALVALGKRQPFVAPSEIRAEVKRIRGGRIMDFQGRHGDWQAMHPDELAESPAAWQRWTYEIGQGIADGTISAPEDIKRAEALMPPLEVKSIESAEVDPGAPGPCTENRCGDPWCNHGGAA